MPASYPAAIKNFLVLEDGVDKVIAAHPNDRGAEITAIETELGTDVAGSAADLKTRLAVGMNNDGTIKTSAVSALLGAWVDKSASYGAQQAATDGFVLVTIHNNTPTGARCQAYTDANANPTTLRGQIYGNDTINDGATITMPVRKGDYWKVILTGSPTIDALYWIPLGS